MLGSSVLEPFIKVLACLTDANKANLWFPQESRKGQDGCAKVRTEYSRHTCVTLATALSSGWASRNCTRAGVSSSWSCAAARPRPRAVAGSAFLSAAPPPQASSASGAGIILIFTRVVSTCSTASGASFCNKIGKQVHRRLTLFTHALLQDMAEGMLLLCLLPR